MTPPTAREPARCTDTDTAHKAPVVPPRVVVVGGGLGGLLVAQNAAHAGMSVVLVEPRPHLVYTPFMIRTLAGDARRQRQALLPHARTLHRRVRHVRAWAVGIDPGERLLAVRPADAPLETQHIPYDYAVLCSGSRSEQGSLALPPHSPAHLASRVVDVASWDAVLWAQGQLRHARQAVVVGGGPSGAEVATLLAETYPALQVAWAFAGRLPLEHLVDSTDALPPLAYYRQHYPNLRLVPEARVQAVQPSPPPAAAASGPLLVLTRDPAQALGADLVFVATGARPAAAWLQRSALGGALGAKGLRVDQDLRVAGQPRVFALGDLADLSPWGYPKTVRPCPSLFPDTAPR